MGGYFLTNSNEKNLEKKVLDIFKTKKMNNYSKICLGEYNLFYFDKIYLKDKINHIFKEKNDYIVGVGTFFYKGKYGQKALKKIYYDYLNKGKKIFNKVKGHFNFIIYINYNLRVVTDRIGSYHSFSLYNGEKKYISTSLFALANVSDELSLRRQEILEFINTEAVYCGNTIFEEINYLPFGYIYGLNNQKEKYFYKDKEINNCNIDNIYKKIKQNISFLKDINLKISAEMSAGFDSRTIVSILKDLNISHNYNTNYNSKDELDHKLAIKIAKSENRNIKVIKKDYQKYNYKDLINNCMYITESARDIFRSAYTPVFFKEKAKYGDIIIGGYGGELYRNVKYKGINNFNDLINKRYSFNLFENGYKYKNKLKSKFLNYLNFHQNKFDDEIIGEIYYFIKMMYWGGSRISSFNQYCYRYHPLLDYELVSPLFKIKGKENSRLQMKLIEKFDYNMSEYKSNYGYNFSWNKSKPLQIKFYSIYKKIWNKIKNIFNTKNSDIYLNEKFISSIFKNNLKRKEIIKNLDKFKLSGEYLSRMYTIEYIIDYLLE